MRNFLHATIKFLSLTTLLTICKFNHLEAEFQPQFQDSYSAWNKIPARLQWNENHGYCGEVSLISAGLYYGQYVSQYDLRAIATKNKSQNKGELLLGINDVYTAAKLHLKAEAWTSPAEPNTDLFLTWVKQKVSKGFPVAIGIYTNEYLFYQNTDPEAGDSEYDHIVPVNGITSNYPLNSPTYHGDDILYFSDNGLWGDPPLFNFSYTFDGFQADREVANAPNGQIYSLANAVNNYGIAILGVKDLEGDTVPVRVETSVNYETPEIVNGSNKRPKAMPLTLKVTVSGLETGVLYYLYRYNHLADVPESQFNAHAKNAGKIWPIQISTGNNFVISEDILSNETIIYRAVKASAP